MLWDSHILIQVFDCLDKADCPLGSRAVLLDIADRRELGEVRHYCCSVFLKDIRECDRVYQSVWLVYCRSEGAGDRVDISKATGLYCGSSCVRCDKHLFSRLQVLAVIIGLWKRIHYCFNRVLAVLLGVLEMIRLVQIRLYRVSQRIHSGIGCLLRRKADEKRRVQNRHIRHQMRILYPELLPCRVVDYYRCRCSL